MASEGVAKQSEDWRDEPLPLYSDGMGVKVKEQRGMRISVGDAEFNTITPPPGYYGSIPPSSDVDLQLWARLSATVPSSFVRAVYRTTLIERLLGRVLRSGERVLARLQKRPYSDWHDAAFCPYEPDPMRDADIRQSNY